MFALLIALLAPALAGGDTQDDTPDVTDGTHLWAKQSIGASGWPTGALADSRVQLRAPLHRSDSVLFQQTFLGAGARLAVSPAFTEVGPQVTIAPIDVFSLDLQATVVRYYGGDGIGLLPFDAPQGKLNSEREGMDSVQAGAMRLSAAPTFKIKVGPIIAFDSWNLTYQRLAPGQAQDKALVFEPYNDLVVAWDDVVIAHQGAVIVEVVPDEGGAFFWAGATARDRMSLQGKDRSTTTGLLLRGKPGKGKAVPALVGQALFYVNDADRVGHVPNLALQASWEFSKGL